MTTTTETTAVTAAVLVHEPGREPSRSERSAVIHTDLDDAASLINSVHAQVLSRVIEARDWNIHRDFDGFSALFAWLRTKFDFHNRVAADIAAIARLSRKFRRLTEAATTGAARIDQVAYAVRQFDATTAMRTIAVKKFREPVPSPWDDQILCHTPEELAAQYCAQAPFADLRRHLDELVASLPGDDELRNELGEASMQYLNVFQDVSGMWNIDARLPSATGMMLDKALATALPPPRQNQLDDHGVLPPAAARRAEALHQILAVYANAPGATQRHGQTCHLNLNIDIATLQGQHTGRTAILEGEPISLAKARYLACEALIIPGVFNYTTGEAIELGRALRLPNRALRRKLEAEQPLGCAWTGCDRSAIESEAHHIQHWANGGPTIADNLILLCRFHHGRIHTNGWTVTKTGPGRALIVHHENHTEDPDPDMQCGCSDYRTDKDLDEAFQDNIMNVFPTGIYPHEYGPAVKDDLHLLADELDHEHTTGNIKAAKAKLRTKFAAPTTRPEPDSGTGTDTSAGTAPEPEATSPTDPETEATSPPRGPHEPVSSSSEPPPTWATPTADAPPRPTATAIAHERAKTAAARQHERDYGPIPFLPHPAARTAGETHHTPSSARTPKKGPGPSPCPPSETGPSAPADGRRQTADGRRQTRTHAPLHQARAPHPDSRTMKPPATPPPRCRRPSEAKPKNTRQPKNRPAHLLSRNR